MLFGAESKRVHVNTLIRVAGVALVRLNPREVGSLTLREAVLSVELQLGSDNRVLSPTMHVQGGLSEHEGASIRDGGVLDGISGTDCGNTSGGVGSEGRSAKSGLVVGVSGSVPVSSELTASKLTGIHCSGGLKETIRVNEGMLADERVGVVCRNSVGSSESMDCVGESVNGIGVVERLGTEHLEQEGVADKGRAVINVLIRLHNPDELLHGVVEVELDLVGGGTNRLVASELELSDEVLVGVLGHSATLVSVQEDIVNVEGSSNQRLVVGDGGRNGLAGGSLSSGGSAAERGNCPQALINRADIKVDLDLMVLKSNQRKSKSRVGAEPELQGHVKGGLRKSVTGSAHLARSLRVARSVNVGERGIGDKSELSGVSNHLEVSSLLLRGHGKLVPDVHPVTILAINALTSNLHLNLGNNLLSREVQPTGIDTRVGKSVGSAHKLVDLRKSHLQVCAISKITIATDRALDTATKISLSVEGLLNRFNSKVGVASVCNLPESDLGVASKVNVLCAVGD